jgi:hypothetical protein
VIDIMAASSFEGANVESYVTQSVHPTHDARMRGGGDGIECILIKEEMPREQAKR